MVFPHNSPDFCLEKLAQQFASPNVKLHQGISDVCFAVTPMLQTLEIFSSIIVRRNLLVQFPATEVG